MAQHRAIAANRGHEPTLREHLASDASADWFAALYDWIEGHEAEVRDATLRQWPEAPASLVAAVADADGAVPLELLPFFEKSCALFGEPAGVLRTAQAIDHAWQGFVDRPEAWPRSTERLVTTGTLGAADRAWVLPQPKRGPPRPAHLVEHYFRFLARHRPDHGIGVEWRPLPVGADLARYRGQVRVAFVPCIDNDDVDFRLLRAGDPAGVAPALLDVVHRPEAPGRVFARLTRAVRFAERSSVPVLLIAPELALTEALWERVREELLAPLADRPRSGGGLQLALLGTAAIDRDEHGHFRNQALLVDRVGTEILRQNKCHPFTLTGDQRDFYDLDGVCCGCEPQEPIRVHPRTLAVRDLAALGRFSVQICEDLAHLEPGPRAGERLGVGLYLCPLMDGAFTEHRWASRWASIHFNVSGARVIAANSLVFPGRSRGISPPHGVGLTAHTAAEAGALGGVHVHRIESADETPVWIDVDLTSV